MLDDPGNGDADQRRRCSEFPFYTPKQNINKKWGVGQPCNPTKVLNLPKYLDRHSNMVYSTPTETPK